MSRGNKIARAYSRSNTAVAAWAPIEDVFMDPINENETEASQIKRDQVLSKQDPHLMIKGLKRYLRELPDLLAQGNEGHVAAYVQGKRIAIVPTKDDLKVFLKEHHYDEADGLFVKRITETDIEDYQISK